MANCSFSNKIWLNYSQNEVKLDKGMIKKEKHVFIPKGKRKNINANKIIIIILIIIIIFTNEKSYILQHAFCIFCFMVLFELSLETFLRIETKKNEEGIKHTVKV